MHARSLYDSNERPPGGNLIRPSSGNNTDPSSESSRPYNTNNVLSIRGSDVAINRTMPSGDNNIAITSKMPPGNSYIAINPTMPSGDNKSAITCTMPSGDNKSAITCTVPPGDNNSAINTSVPSGGSNMNYINPSADARKSQPNNPEIITLSWGTGHTTIQPKPNHAISVTGSVISQPQMDNDYSTKV